MDERWKLTEVRGWGPDYSDVIVRCRVARCTWERVWDTDVDTTLDVIVHAIQQHMESEHGRA